METTSATSPQTPQVPQKSGCLRSCLVSLLVLLLLLAGASLGLFYAVKNAHLPVPSTETTTRIYQEYIRPQLLERLPKNMTATEKKKILDIADSSFENFQTLPEAERKALLQEMIIAYYYLSQNKIAPPEKITHLQAFIEKHMQEYEMAP